MGQPLKPVGPQRRTAPHQPRINEDEVIDRLAERIADENDQRARQRMDEMWNPQKYWTPSQKKNSSITVWVCFLLMVAIVVFALNCHR